MCYVKKVMNCFSLSIKKLRRMKEMKEPENTFLFLLFLTQEPSDNITFYNYNYSEKPLRKLIERECLCDNLL